MNFSDTPSLHEQVGYNYVATVLELLKLMTYQELANAIGYKSKGAISKILDGSIPAHIHGEALWALYMEKYGQKPPMTVRQRGQQAA